MSKKKAKSRAPAGKPITRTTNATATPPLPKHRRYIFTAVALLFPVVLLALLELALRAADFGNNLRLAHRIEENGKVWWEINPNIGQRYFGLQPEFARQAEEARIAFVRPANGFRVICMGESSMAGFPYNKNAAMPGILRTYLQQLFPDRDIEVVNLGIAATNSFAVRDLMRDVIALAPDAILVYAGHNEFYGALGVGSTFSMGGNRNLVNLYLWLLRYRTFYLLQQAVRKVIGVMKDRGELEATMRQPVMQQMARRQTIPYGSELFTTATEIFQQNLTDIVKMANAARVPIVIGNLVSNLKDQPPFDSMEAALCYDRGKSALASGDSMAAARLFSRARDLDLLRFRAPDTFNVVIKNVCEKNAAPMIDVARAFRVRCAGGIIGRELIAEHLHPTVRGYVVMAKTFLRGLAAASLMPAPVDSARLAALPEDPAALNITVLDEEIGRLRILNLTSEWPFKQAVNLPVAMEAQIAPLVQEIAGRYINRQISWGQAHLELAGKLTKMKENAAALAEYRALAQEYPAEFALFDNIGETLMALQRYEEALAAFVQSLRLNANSPSARAGVGKACLFLARFQEAEAAFAEAIKLDETMRRFSAAERSFIFYLWGGALTNLGRYRQAEEKFLEALRLDPGNTLAQNFLATLRARLR